MTRYVTAAMVLAGLLAGLPAPADACNCPKEQLMKLHGTVSQVPLTIPLPPPLPPAKSDPVAVTG